MRFGCGSKAQQPHDHRVDLFLACTARTDQGPFDARVTQRMHGDTGLRACQTKHAASVTHQQRRPRIFIARIELLDDDERRRGLCDHLGDAGMQLAQALLEGRAGTRDDDSRLDQLHPTVSALDDPVSGRAQRRIDAENADVGLRCDYGGGVPLTVTLTEEPGASALPAAGSVPTTFPPAPTLVV